MTARAITGTNSQFPRLNKAERKELAKHVSDNGKPYSARDDVAKHPHFAPALKWHPPLAYPEGRDERIKVVEESVRRGFQDIINRNTHPISELWHDIEVRKPDTEVEQRIQLSRVEARTIAALRIALRYELREGYQPLLLHSRLQYAEELAVALEGPKKPAPATPAQVAALQVPPAKAATSDEFIEAIKAQIPPKPLTITERVIEPVSNEDALDAAAEAKWKIKPSKINELYEAIQIAIKHPGNAEAQCLTDGFQIAKNGHSWKLTHPAIRREPVIATRLDEKEDYRDVTRRSDVRECLIALREAVAEKKARKSVSGNGATTVGEAALAFMDTLAAHPKGFVDGAGKVWGL